jgi:hypothetical protein
MHTEPIVFSFTMPNFCIVEINIYSSIQMELLFPWKQWLCNKHATMLHYTYIAYLVVYLFIQTYFHTSHSGTYCGNGKNHIHYTSSCIYNLMQLTAGWKEYIKTTVTICII